MIKANELRIGNWVADDAPAYPVYRRVDADLIKYIEINGEGTMSAIPLTSEILEKAKFGGTIFPSQISISDSGKYYWGNGINVEIKYLHQLQNLVHSLTGTELEINLNL